MIDAQDIYTSDACLRQMAIHFPNIGKAKVAYLIATAREVTPKDAASIGVDIGTKDRGFIFKEYLGVVAVKAQSGPGRHPFAAIAYHPIPDGYREEARERFPFPAPKNAGPPNLAEIFGSNAEDLRKTDATGRKSGMIRWKATTDAGTYDADVQQNHGQPSTFRLTADHFNGERRTVYAQIDLHPLAAPETALMLAQKQVEAKWASKGGKA